MIKPFTKVVSPFEREITALGIPILDERQIKVFTEDFTYRDFLRRLANLRKSEPFRSFIHHHIEGVNLFFGLVIFLCLGSGFLQSRLLKSSPLFILLFSITVASALVIFIANVTPARYTTKETWISRGFSEFVKEYDKVGASEIKKFLQDSRIMIGDYIVGSLIVLYHQNSSKRFLIIEEPFSKEWFYIDSWDKPQE